jgi:hypothetical protein
VNRVGGYLPRNLARPRPSRAVLWVIIPVGLLGLAVLALAVYGIALLDTPIG